MIELFLVPRTPDFPQHEWPLSQGEHVVGRSKDCDIVIFDETVSREHARMFVENDVVKIVDLGSRNGTHIGNSRVAEEEVVTVGSAVRFGRIECVLADSRMLQEFEKNEYSTIPIERQNAKQMCECLSVAEQRVLPYLLEGLSEKEVAYRLGLSPNTVHHHIGSIYRTLDVSSRGELLALLLRQRSG